MLFGLKVYVYCIFVRIVLEIHLIDLSLKNVAKASHVKTVITITYFQQSNIHNFSVIFSLKM